MRARNPPDGRTIVCDYTNAGGLAVGATAPVLAVVSAGDGDGRAVQHRLHRRQPAGGRLRRHHRLAAGRRRLRTRPTTATPSPSTGTASGPDLAIAKTTSTPTGGDKTVSVERELGDLHAARDQHHRPAGTDVATGIVHHRHRAGLHLRRAPIDQTPVVATASAAQHGDLRLQRLVGHRHLHPVGRRAARRAARVTVPITVNRPLAAGTYTNTATVSNTAEGDSNSANNSASDTVTIAPIADIELTGKTVTPAGGARRRAARPTSSRTATTARRRRVGGDLSDVFTFPAGDPALTVMSIVSSKPGSTLQHRRRRAAQRRARRATPATSATCRERRDADASRWSCARTSRPATRRATSSTRRASRRDTPESPDRRQQRQQQPLRRRCRSRLRRVDLLTNKVDLRGPGAVRRQPRYHQTTASPSRATGRATATGVRINERMAPPQARRMRFVCDTTGRRARPATRRRCAR